MKGRNSFSQSEAAQIRDLLEQKIKSGNLKSFRNKLRSIGFFSDDFKRVASGFSPQDFDDLIRAKRISITDRLEPQYKAIELQTRTSTNESRIQGLLPIVAEQAQIIILGTMLGGKSLALGEYYADSSNKFWQIIEMVFGNNSSDTYQNRINCLNSNYIALWDVLSSCERPGSLDKSIVNSHPNEFEPFFTSYPAIKAVFFNGQRAKNYYESLVLPTLSNALKQYPLIALPSSSGTCTKSPDFKAKIWEAQIKEHLVT